MRTSLVILFLSAVLTFGSAVAQTPAEYLRQARVEANENKAALDAAYKEIDRTLLSAKDRIVVIRRIGKFVVVSVIASAKNVRGGRVYVVYDPERAKVVYTLAED